MSRPIPPALARSAARVLSTSTPHHTPAVNRATSPLSIDGANGTNERNRIKRLAFVCASDVKMEAVRYLWEGFIPLGKVTGIEGRMGDGKTTIIGAVAAAVTTGGPLPGQSSTPQGAVGIISLEDDKGDTLVPRLCAAGADLKLCHLFDGYEFGGATEAGMFDIADDIERLRWIIEDKGLRYVAIDPFTAALPQSVNSHKDQDVRRVVLAPLAQLAADTGAAIVFVRHFRKSGGSAVDAGGGSGGIGNACRSVLRVDPDPETAERYLLSSVKTSTSKKPPTVGYRIEGVTLPHAGSDGEPIVTSRIAWDGISTWTADTLAAHAMNSEDRPRADEAQDWLKDALLGGPRLAKELFRAADSDGIPRRTLQRAADVLGVLKERRGFGEGSNWSLPDSIRAKETPFAPSKTMAQMGTNGTNGERPVLDIAV